MTYRKSKRYRSSGGTVSRESDTVAFILQRADAMMYKSKTAGWNRVTIG